MWLQDSKSVSEYNSALFKTSLQLKLCGENIIDEDMLEKTFTTFYASNMLLQQQYRERRFIKYSELIACLLVAEKNNELLLKNHKSRPTGSKAFPEANATFASPIATDKGTKMGRLWGKDKDVVVVEGVAVVIIPDIITLVPSKIRKAIPIKGSCQIHKQPLARVSLNTNKILPAIDVA